MYQLFYSPIDGTVSSIKRNSDDALIPLADGNTDYQEFLEWNAQQAVPLDLSSVSQEILDANAAMIARQEAKRQAIIDNLPSWAVVGRKFDTMSAAVPTATNAQLKDILVELITTTKKLARVVYWLAKDTEK
jgi:hypothetical protein